MHALRWDPHSVREFVTVGEAGAVLFWLVDETTKRVSLNVHQAELDQVLETAGDNVSWVLLLFCVNCVQISTYMIYLYFGFCLEKRK